MVANNLHEVCMPLWKYSDLNGRFSYPAPAEIVPPPQMFEHLCRGLHASYNVWILYICRSLQTTIQPTQKCGNLCKALHNSKGLHTSCKLHRGDTTSLEVYRLLWRIAYLVQPLPNFINSKEVCTALQTSTILFGGLHTSCNLPESSTPLQKLYGGKQLTCLQSFKLTYMHAFMYVFVWKYAGADVPNDLCRGCTVPLMWRFELLTPIVTTCFWTSSFQLTPHMRNFNFWFQLPPLSRSWISSSIWGLLWGN